MDTEKKSHIARQLTAARRQRKPVPQWSQSQIVMTRSEAYEIQEQGIRHRLDQAEIRVGYKMGLTSEGKRKQMNLNSPLYGELTDQMQLVNSSIFEISSLIHPKIEPEIAFKVDKTLSGPITWQQAVDSISHISATMEILDSRYDQFKYFSMEDVIADNSSSSHFVTGLWIPFTSPDQVKTARLEMYINDNLSQAGEAREISGDPIQSLVQLCTLLSENNRILEAGSIVLAGAATAAVPLKDKQKVQLNVTGLPPVQIHIKGNTL